MSSAPTSDPLSMDGFHQILSVLTDLQQQNAQLNQKVTVNISFS
jgi:hypothetical protein